MKTVHSSKCIVHSWACKVVLLLAIFNVQLSFLNSLQAQVIEEGEAFYIYRNDGDFDGFFYDQIQEMRYSKLDVDSVEQAEYVTYEVVTADSIYRIPLAAIDSIGFVQPDAILNENFIDLDVKQTRGSLYDGNPYLKDFTLDSEPLNVSTPTTFTTMEVEPSETVFYFYSGKCNEWGGNLEDEYVAGKDLRSLEAGSVFRLTLPSNDYHPEKVVVMKVLNVEPKDFPLLLPDQIRDTGNGYAYYTTTYRYYVLTCEPIDDIGLVFEQLIGVEEVGVDSHGNAHRRVAGLQNVKQRRRIEGNRGLTLVDISKSFGIDFPLNDAGDLKLKLAINLNWQTKMQVVYNIGLKRGLYTKMTIKNAAEANFTVQVDAEMRSYLEKNVLPAVSVKFPAALPLFEVRPSPGAFTRVEGHLQINLGSPKYGFSNTTTITIDTKKDFKHMISATNTPSTTKPGAEDNGWTLEWAINGLVQTGVWFPIKLYTNSWAKNFVELSIGTDLYIGPKLSANLSLDVFTDPANKQSDIYDALKGTQLSLTPVCVYAKTNANLSVRGEKGELTLIDGPEMDFEKRMLNLFPEFEKLEFTYPVSHGTTIPPAIIRPRGYCTPCGIGLALLDNNDRLIDYKASGETYSVFYTWDETTLPGWAVPIGKWKVCPAVTWFGNVFPAKSAAKEWLRTSYEDGDSLLFLAFPGNSHPGFDSSDSNPKTVIVRGLTDDAEVSVVFQGEEDIFGSGVIQTNASCSYEIGQLITIDEAQSQYPQIEYYKLSGKLFDSMPANESSGTIGLTEKVCPITFKNGSGYGWLVYKVVVKQGGVTIDNDRNFIMVGCYYD